MSPFFLQWLQRSTPLATSAPPPAPVVVGASVYTARTPGMGPATLWRAALLQFASAIPAAPPIPAPPTLDAAGSLGLYAGPSLAQMSLVSLRTIEALGAPAGPVDGEFEVAVPAAHNYDASVLVRQLDPLHVTLVYLALDVDFGG